MTDEEKAAVIDLYECKPQRCLLCGKVVSILEQPAYSTFSNKGLITVALHNECGAAVLHTFFEAPATPEMINILGQAQLFISR